MRQALELALEALEDIKDDCSGCKFEWSNDYPLQAKAHAAIKEALAQPEQEPVACVGPWHDCRLTLIPRYSHQTFERDQPLYTTPPQRKPLTDEQIQKCYETTGHYQTLRPQDKFAVFALARAIEAAHGIKE